MTETVSLAVGADQAGFRRAVRRLLAEDVPPDQVMWTFGDNSLFGRDDRGDGAPVMLPRAVSEMILPVVCHRDPERYALLYRLVWRVRHGEAWVLDNPADPLVHRLEAMRKSVRRDLHKMHAFVRFREVVGPDGVARYVAWFEPEHDILAATAGFFVERFRGMVWAILTPFGSLRWDTERLVIGPAGRREDLPAGDGFEAGWCSYYESIFNPARVNPTMMRSEMAMKYWHNLPEAALIPRLVREAAGRTEGMIARVPAATVRRDPERAVQAMEGQDPRSLAELNRIIAASAPLVSGGTRAVLGEGPAGGIAFVGEQPGDMEDMAGRPFVGPAGQMLDRAMAEAGIERSLVYLTNAVKHFKYEHRGKRRMHATPTAGEVKHYRWWLMRELEFVAPTLVVALGATALMALAGKAMPLLRNRGVMDFGGIAGFVTVHPSYLLRLPDEVARLEAFGAFVGDLRRVREMGTTAGGDGPAQGENLLI